MGKYLKSAEFAKTAFVVCMSVLAWDAHCLYARLDKLECNQVAIMIHMGIQPDSGVKSGCFSRDQTSSNESQESNMCESQIVTRK